MSAIDMSIALSSAKARFKTNTANEFRQSEFHLI